jgi:1-deoxy-D-xylulose-5-phosphate reductoisomerase
MNAANEEVVNAFLCDRIGFFEMSDIIEEVLVRSSYKNNLSLEDFRESDKEARILTNKLIG